MCFGGGGGSRELERMQQKQADDARVETERKATSLRTGMDNINKAFGGFNDDYFAGLAKDYMSFAQPQVEDQYNEAKKNITFALARHGNLASTVAGDQYGALDKENARALQTISSTAQDTANQGRKDVYAAKQGVIGQLNATFDADAANNNSIDASNVLAAVKKPDPIGTLFSNVAGAAAQAKLSSEGNPASSPYYAGARNYGSGSTSYAVR